jgi:hypothetical protein
MLFKDKAFPYPILDRSDRDRDDYIDGDYQAIIRNSEPNDNGVVTFSVMHQCSVVELNDLVIQSKAKYGVLIVCSDTLTRKAYLSSEARQEIQINMYDYHGKVELTPQLVAVETIPRFSSVDLNAEYGDVTFELHPGDVLAIDKPEVRFFEFNRLKFETLITVKRSESIDPFSYRIDLDSNYIYILMGIRLRDLWGELRADIDSRPFLAMSIYKDCFLHAIEELVNNEDALEHRWARALSQKLEELNIAIPEKPDLNDMNLIAQKILENESVRKLYDNKDLKS